MRVAVGQAWVRGAVGSLLALALVFAGTTGVAQAVDTGVIQGTVTDPNGVAVSGLTVRLHRYHPIESRGLPGFVIDAALTVTDANGHYRVDGLNSDLKYLIDFDAANTGYMDTYYCAGPVQDCVKSLPFSYAGTLVNPSQTGETFDQQLPWGNTVTGRVVDSAGRPISTAAVTVLVNEPYLTHRVRSAVMGADGTFTIYGLAPSSGYQYHISAPGYFASRLDPPAPPPEVTVTLNQGSRVSGTVTDADGKPVAGAEVLCHSDTDYPYALRYFDIDPTGADGAYQVMVDPANTPATCYASRSGYTDSLPKAVTVVDTVDQPKTDLALRPPASLTVRITYRDGSSDKATVYAVRSGTPVGHDDEAEVVTTGNTASMRLAAGRYNISVVTARHGETFAYVNLAAGEKKTLVVPVGSEISSLIAPRPTVVGKARVGAKLVAAAGTWGPGAVKLTYRWLRNGKPIRGATTKSYRLTKADRGKRISVKVTGSKSGFHSVAKVSKKTKKVGPPKRPA